MKFKRAAEIIGRFQGARILVVGDIILDEFIWGKVRRISPEAPVPVVEVREETLRLGGAANVINNILALGAEPTLLGAIGNDYGGRRVMKLLESQGAETSGIISDKERRTSIKTRIIAQHQQVVRFDRESPAEVSRELKKSLLDHVKANSGRYDGVIISDYGKGIISREVVDALLKAFKPAGKCISVDPKVVNFKLYRNVTVITPNQYEAGDAAGIEIKDEKSLLKAGNRILKMLKCKSVLVTMGEQGMCLMEKGKPHIQIPTMAKEVFDVTGAGDTVISALTLAVVGGAAMEEAALISNHAAGIVVGKLGTATASRKELESELGESL